MVSLLTADKNAARNGQVNKKEQEQEQEQEQPKPDNTLSQYQADDAESDSDDDSLVMEAAILNATFAYGAQNLQMDESGDRYGKAQTTNQDLSSSKRRNSLYIANATQETLSPPKRRNSLFMWADMTPPSSPKRRDSLLANDKLAEEPSSPKRRSSLYVAAGTSDQPEPRKKLTMAVKSVIQRNRRNSVAMAMNSVIRGGAAFVKNARADTVDNANSSNSQSLFDSDGGESMKSLDEAGDFLVDFPSTREHFTDRQEIIDTMTPTTTTTTTTTEPRVVDNTSNNTTSTTAVVPIQEYEIDQRRPWRRGSLPKPTKSEYESESSFGNSISSFCNLETDHLLNVEMSRPTRTTTTTTTTAVTTASDSDPYFKELLHNPNNKNTIYSSFDSDALLYNRNYLERNDGVGANNEGREDDSSVVTELRLAQAALGWKDNDDDDNDGDNGGIRSNGSRFQQEFGKREKGDVRRRGEGHVDGELPMNEFMANLAAKAAKRVALLREKQNHMKELKNDREAIAARQEIKTEQKATSVRSKPTRPTLQRRPKSFIIMGNLYPKDELMARRFKSESDLDRLKSALKIDATLSGDKSSQNTSKEDDEGRRRHRHRRHHHRRRHHERDTDEHGGKRHKDRHRSKSRHRHNGDEQESGVSERRHRSKTRKHRNRNRKHSDEEQDREGWMSENAHPSYSREARPKQDLDGEFHVSSYQNEGEDESSTIPSRPISKETEKALAMFGIGRYANTSFSNSDMLNTSRSLLHHENDDLFDDEALPTAVLGEDSDVEAQDNLSVPDAPVPGVQSISNFHSVFARAQKKPETSFQGIWSDDDLNSRSDDASVASSHQSHRITRLQQVKVTLRTRGFGLKMQRICGAGVWQKKWYILGGLILLVLVLAISIPLASRGNSNPTPSSTEIPTVTPTGSPTKIPSFELMDEVFGEKAGDVTGAAVSLSSDGRFLAVGMPQEAVGSGEVRIYQIQDNEFLPYGEPILGVEQGDSFGNSLSISDDGQRVAIGSPKANDNTGYAVVFEYNLVSMSWQQLGENIVLSQSDGLAGSAVSISGNGNRVAVGAPRSNNDDGLSMIFQYNSVTNIWTRYGQNIVGASGELHGYSITLDTIGDTVAIGAVQSESPEGRRGRVYVYEVVGTQWKLLGNFISGNDLFGRSVSLSFDGRRLAIGATGVDSDSKVDVGACEVYGYVGGWVRLGNVLQGEQGDERSGYSVSLSRDGQRVACGGPGDSVVRVYTENNGAWEQLGLSLKGSPGTNFGAAVSLNSNGNLVAIGGPHMAIDGDVDVGAAILYMYGE